MIKENKAQINQVFMILFALIIIGVIALFGAKSLSGIFADKCLADSISFQNKFADTIQNNNDWGSVHEYTFGTPCDYTTLCLVDARSINNGAFTISSDIPFYYLINNSVHDGVLKNIFLIKNGQLQPTAYVSELHLTEDKTIPLKPLCVRAHVGRYTFIMKGLGSTTYVRLKNEDTQHSNNQQPNN